MYKPVRAISLVAAALLVASCATTAPNRSEVRQFDPLPATEVAVEDLEPVRPESISKLLADAETSFREANAAQERGDHEAALKHYTAMLELLIDADLDPKVFYQLRTEFERILDTSFREAKLLAPAQPHIYRIQDLPEFSSDIEFPDPLPEPVLAEIDLILKAYPERFQAALDRSNKYAPYIRHELANAGLPQDLCWLVMVESQFTPKINSPAGAGGMWQFMKTTGKRYNLRVDSYVDERYNWQKSTEAAIGYLRDLYIFFDGSWPLAVTAYNMGEGGLSRAMNASGGERDIWRLISEGPSANIIRSETKKYYPRLLASIIVAKNPERYGFSRGSQTPDDCIMIAVNGAYSLESLEKNANVPSGTLNSLNPHILRGITPPDGLCDVAVPSDFGQKVQLALQSTPKYSPPAPKVHVVRRGETLAGIANKYGTSARTLAKINKLRSPNHLLVGQRLTLSPDANVETVGEEPESVVLASTKSSSNVSTKPSSKASNSAVQKSYKVRRGDTLFDIARAHRVSIEDLQQWNGMKRSSRIQVGQTLKVSPPDVEAVQAPGKVVTSGEEDAPLVASLAKADATPDESTRRYHTVQKGEFPGKIASLYDVDLQEFLKWNNLTEHSSIQVGDTLVVYGKGREVMGTNADVLNGHVERKEESPAPVKTHTVSKGETAGTIAAKYKVKTSDLLKSNNLTSRSVLHIGDTLTIPGSGSGSSSVAKSAQDERIEHVVANGHNPTTIARRYGVSVKDLFEWNGWKKAPVLHVGDKVIVYKK